MDTLLKKTRKSLGFTQTQIAKAADITVICYQNYEAGRRLPNVHTAQLIAKALKTTVEILFPVTDATEDGEVM